MILGGPGSRLVMESAVIVAPLTVELEQRSHRQNCGDCTVHLPNLEWNHEAHEK